VNRDRITNHPAQDGVEKPITFCVQGQAGPIPSSKLLEKQLGERVDGAAHAVSQ